nr:hypothetical protein [Tanacetum cinerariifolium]
IVKQATWSPGIGEAIGVGSGRSTSRCHRAHSNEADTIVTALDDKVGTVNLRGRAPAESHAPGLGLGREESQHHGQRGTRSKPQGKAGIGGWDADGGRRRQLKSIARARGQPGAGLLQCVGQVDGSGGEISQPADLQRVSPVGGSTHGQGNREWAAE